MNPRPLYIGDDTNGQAQFLTPKERTTGVHIIGAPGSGKSQAANLTLEQDERELPGGGLVLDPHGNDPDSLYGQALARATRYRPRRPTYFVNLSAPRHVYGFSIFARRESGDISTRVQRCVRALFTAWGEPDPYERPRLLFWSTALFAVGMHRGDVGLTEMRLLLDHEQAALREHLTADTPVAGSWRALSHKRHEQFDEQVEAARNRIDALTSAAAPRRFLSLIHPPAMIDFRDLFRRGAWVYVNLQPSPDLDREHARVIGTLLASDFVEQACQRPNPARAPVALYIDEAHQFVSRDLALIFEEGRKFHVYTTLLHQHLEQLRQDNDERVLDAILSCALTKMVFGVGSDKDARSLVHEVFVGPHGINYTEPKFVHPNTKFRPVAIRDQTFSRGRGGGTTKSYGGNRSTSIATTQGTAHSHSRTQSHDVGHSIGASESSGTSRSMGQTRGVSATHTVGHGRTKSQARGVALGHAHGHSQSIGHVHTETENHGSASTYGITSSHSDGFSTPSDPALLATQTTSDSTGISDSFSESHNYGTSDTTSQSESSSEIESETRSFVEAVADSESESDAEGWSAAESESQSESHGVGTSRTDSESTSESEGETETESVARGRTYSQGEDWSRGTSHSWVDTVIDGPSTRYDAFREDQPEFYSLEEQRQRKADALRLQPQRSFVLRRPDCSNVSLTVPLQTLRHYSPRLLLAYETQSASKTGAVRPEEADALIESRVRAIETAAVVDLEVHPRANQLLPRMLPPPRHDDAPTTRKIAARRRVRPSPTLNPATRAK
jgi:hypothetical protein